MTDGAEPQFVRAKTEADAPLRFRWKSTESIFLGIELSLDVEMRGERRPVYFQPKQMDADKLARFLERIIGSPMPGAENVAVR